jgi:hypothetical protein
VRLYPSEDGGDCPGELEGALQFLESATLAIASYLEVPAPRVDYHWMSASRWPEGTPCAAHALGCTDRHGHVYAKVLSPHELVHAVVVQHFGGFRVSFLDEGVAEALGAPVSEGDVVYVSSLGDLLAASKIEAVDYGAAGHFVSYLLAVHGADRFRQLLARAPLGTAVDDLRKSFGDIYGATPEAIMEEGWKLHALGVAYCGAAPSLDSHGGSIRTSGSPSCNWPVGAAAVDVGADGLHRIDWHADADASFHLRWCPLSAPPFEFFGASSYSATRTTEVAQLRQGRYLLALSGEPSATGAFDLRQAEGDCSHPLELSGHRHQLRVKPGTGETKTVYFRAPEASAEARIHAYDGEVALSLCEKCAAHPCTSLVDRQHVELTPGTIYALRVSTAAWGDEAGLDF